MNQTLNPPLSKAKEASISRKLDEMFSQLRESNRATLEIRKDIEKLKRSNDRSFELARRAVEALAKY